MADKLMVVIPCYNEEEVLPETSRRLVEKMASLTRKGLISPDSRVLLVDDGSRDRTWELISALHKENPLFEGRQAQPQPRPSERAAGRADDGARPLRHVHLDGRGFAG